VQVGMTKDQVSYNKPSAAVHPGALDAGTLPQYNKIQCRMFVLYFTMEQGHLNETLGHLNMNYFRYPRPTD
jgi:hypothetical protein